MDKKDYSYLSLPHVILSDGVLLLYFSAVLPAIIIMIVYVGPDIELFLWIIAIALFSIYLTTWRYDRVCRAFTSGREVKGKVLGIARLFVFPIQGIEYVFQVDGKDMRHSSFHFDGERVRKIKVGDVISIMVDPDNSKYSFLKDIYCY